MTPHLEDAARRGHVAVGMDGRYHGRRGGDYAAALARAGTLTRPESESAPGDRPFVLDSAWDVHRVMDYLCTRPDVDSARIGCCGISLGGMVTLVAAASDDRIAAAASVIGTQGFAWGLAHDAWQARAASIAAAFLPPAIAGGLEADSEAARVGRLSADAAAAVWARLAPGLATPAAPPRTQSESVTESESESMTPSAFLDCPAILPLISPRPLLVLAGADDPRCPLGGVFESAASARAAYAESCAAPKFKLEVAAGVGHVATAAMHAAAAAWLDFYLAPECGPEEAAARTARALLAETVAERDSAD